MEKMYADEYKPCIDIKKKMLLQCWVVFHVYQNINLFFRNYLQLKKKKSPRTSRKVYYI